MNFVKGTMMGIIAGTIVGTMNSDTIITMINRGKKELRKMKKKYRM